MELFSANRDDCVMIFEEKNPHTVQLSKNLREIGLHVFQPTYVTKDRISQFLFYTFIAQMVPLLEAKQRNQKDCYFVTSKKLRNVSNKMIY